MRNLRVQSFVGNTAAVASALTETVLLAQNEARLGACVYNDSTSALFLKCGEGVSSASFTVKLAAGGYYELPNQYVGIVTGVWDTTADGDAKVTEFK